jgi:ABC-2 type transport system ATP-binding protein
VVIFENGHLVAEGTPDDLKRSVGTDVIVVRLDGDANAARAVVKGLEGVVEAEVHGDELTISTHDGAATVSPVAVALDGCDVRVRELTLRTPTLDDVFLELTGNRIANDGSSNSNEETS